MRKVIEYRMANGDREDIAVEINKLIKDGFQPWGSALMEEGTTYVLQPMVKYAE
jgi:hypothetical protein